MPDSKPVILVVDEDPQRRANVARELTTRYGADYAILVERSTDEARQRLGECERDDVPVALILARHTAGGVELLAAAHTPHRHTKRALLLRWGENRAAREQLIHVLALGQADYFVVEPSGSPDERFHRAITEFLDEWWRLRGVPFEALRVVADARSARAHEICDLLQRHDLPYGFCTTDSPAGRTALRDAGIEGENRPVVILPDGRALVAPTNVEVAAAVGARTKPGPGVYDVVVIGAGPAGLSVAVYAESEGLRTALVEGLALGGQAGTSSLIRNYLGFPRGITGAELAARAVDQAILFGTEIVYGAYADALEVRAGLHVVRLRDGSEIETRTVVIATGVSYRQLDVPALEPYNGVGVFYGAAMSEARALLGEPVFVVGGGNSAGQAARYLAKFAARVTILVRSETLARSMSHYLVKEIDAAPNIDVCYGVEVVDGGGDGRLEWIALEDRNSGEITRRPAAALFVLIGAEPCTDWLPSSIARDLWGYVITGAECGDPSSRSSSGVVDEVAPDAGAPLIFETSAAGVFAVGDVRRGSVKRVASAAGEGAICVRLIHDHLARGT
jgi:thioredoxin reductase (NADPH)